MVIFLGDIAYDFVGEKYISMLKYMQPITSRVCFMVTPGNHDYTDHQDAFELFMQTFLSPNWHNNFNFYYNMVIGHTIFISFNPEEKVYEKNYADNMNPL